MHKAFPLLVVALLTFSGCGVAAHDALDGTRTTLSQQPTPFPDAPLPSEAEHFARTLHITPEEAFRRMQLEDDIGQLNTTLLREEPETYAGLWIQHEPVYRVVVSFTRDGEERVQPYVSGTPLEAEIEVRQAAVSYARLQAVEEETHRLLGPLGLPYASTINVVTNQVELSVTDRARFERQLADVGLTLPDHVTITTLPAQANPSPPADITPAPGVIMPKLHTRSLSWPALGLQGELIVHNGCLRVSPGAGDPGVLIIWQPDYWLSEREGRLELVNQAGNRVARVGEAVVLMGGPVGDLAVLASQLQAPLDASCAGPYFLMGQFSSTW